MGGPVARSQAAQLCFAPWRRRDTALLRFPSPALPFLDLPIQEVNHKACNYGACEIAEPCALFSSGGYSPPTSGFSV